MRALGVNERFITGDASDKEKFLAWAKSVPQTLRNPLYHWTHLELKRYFGIDELLNEDSADRIYENVKTQLQKPENSCRGLLKKMNVETVVTTDDPLDSLEYHQQLKESDFDIKVSTAFRPDKTILIDAETYNEYIDKLSEVSGITIDSFENLKKRLRNELNSSMKMGADFAIMGLTKFPFLNLLQKK